MLMAAVAAVLLLGPGCAPRADAVAEETSRADGAAASRSVSAEELAEWRATVGRLRGELAALAERSAGSAEDSRRRMDALADQLASLERRIAAHESGAAAPVQANNPVGDGDVDVNGDGGGGQRPSAENRPRRDERVEPAHAQTPAGTGAHPFTPAVKRARAALAGMESIKDYSAVMVKQVRMDDGKLRDMEFLHAKIRHEPLSVYLRFLAPQELRDREVIYVEGQNDGNLLAHESPNRKGVIGLLSRTPLVGTTSLAPDSTLAMVGNRYPITEIGILNLTLKLIEVGEQDMQHDPSTADAKYYPNAKVEDRECEAFVFVHPERGNGFTFHRAEIFIDKKLNLPIRYVSYDWPESPGETPPLIESYTYTRLKLNVGLTDEDFDTKNPKYKFPK
jgi:outer membrane lipoprotein-sorting protein